jgi:hypothetical protein
VFVEDSLPPRARRGDEEADDDEEVLPADNWTPAAEVKIRQ